MKNGDRVWYDGKKARVVKTFLNTSHPILAVPMAKIEEEVSGKQLEVKVKDLKLR